MQQTDYLVIGSGIAGLTFAIKIAERFRDREVVIVTKAGLLESNTKYAQGGIAAVYYHFRDSYEAHIKDTLIAGDGLCNREVVEMVVKEGPQRIRELIQWGVQFDRNKVGKFHLGKEGGHSFNRVLHHKDSTGLEIEETLVKRIKQLPNVRILPYHLALDLIIHPSHPDATEKIEQACMGAYVMNVHTLSVEPILAKTTLLASGGLGQVYETTTNPLVATGDGVAMAIRAGVELENMEFIQFHPTALYAPGENPAFLISEAVRGMGAILRNNQGEAFMKAYHHQADLAPRDSVARAIDHELKKSGKPYLYLDCSAIPEKDFAEHFPTILAKCHEYGIHPPKEMIPVAPAAHYSCGGIKTDIWGRTSLPNLYACGECASTGLHGANRLASNSLLEGLVFAHRCYQEIASCPCKQRDIPVKDWEYSENKPINLSILPALKERIKEIMSHQVGIVKTDLLLKKALMQLMTIQQEVEDMYATAPLTPSIVELRTLATVAVSITQSAIRRKENAGLHYNLNNVSKEMYTL